MSYAVPPWALLLISAPLLWTFVAWGMTRPSAGWRRTAFGGISLTLATLTPWLMPADLPWLRFMVLVPCFAAAGKTLDVLTGKLPSPERMHDLRRFLIWAVVVPDGDWPQTPDERQAVRTQSMTVLGRGLLKVLAAAGLVALNSTVSLHSNLWLSCLWMAFFLNFCLTGALDLIFWPLRLAGARVDEAFDAPPLARNPRDFWSRRWNLWFSRASHRMIFVPLGGAQHPVRASAAVFIFSAVVHEYMVWVALGAPDGRMTAFFLLHGVATFVTTLIGKRLGRKTLMPRWAAVALHIAWFALTGPLFFGPMEDIFALSAWRW